MAILNEKIADVLLVLVIFGMLVVLAEQWTTQLVGFKIFELRDFFANLFPR
jgi:hypothetical protein